MKKFLLLFLLLPLGVKAQVCSVADPQGKTISWDPPTTYEDGTPLGTDLDGYFIYYGKTQSGQYELAPIDVTSSTSTSFDLTCLEPNTNYFLVMTAYVPCNLQPTAEECQNGETRLESRHSEELAFTTEGPAVLPNPPINLVVSQEDRTAYAIEEVVDGLLLHPVGVVRADTSCDGSQTVNGMYVVPKSEVIWFSSEFQVVVAKCDG